MRNVLIGGFITLIVTLLVQIFVIPRVQRQTRKRERWERDVTELQTLLEVEFPRNIRTLRRSVVPYFVLQALPPEPREHALSQPSYMTAEADAVAAYDALSDTAMRALWLARRAAIYKPGRLAYWAGLMTSIGELNGHMMALAPRGVADGKMTAKEYEGVLDEVHRLGGLVLVTLTQTADPLEPPKARPLRSVRRWLGGRQRQIAGRLSRRKSTTANKPDASPDPG